MHIQDREKLAAVDLLPTVADLTLRLAENVTERAILLRLKRLVWAAHAEKQRLIGLSQPYSPTPSLNGHGNGRA